jgi:hypothetical protein
MSNYTKSTNFATKDNLTPGDPLKIVRGTEIDTEYNNIATAIATKTDNSSAAITGGTINATTIGATTASTGAFSTLSATGAITSTLATGTAPLVIASTTKVANLNVDSLDGADWASPAALGSTTPAAVSATTLTTSSTVTFNGGTANGVAYLNGSKVVTSGSALTFDGTNLGIGTSSPVYKLDVRGSVYVQRDTNPTNALALQLTNQTTSSNNGCRLSFDSYNIGSSALGVPTDSASLAFYTGGVTTERARIDASGNLGVGTTSPSQKLDVNGNITATAWIGRANGSAPSADCAIYRAADNTLGFSTASTEQMRLTSTGLGIGTSSPSAKLDVAGNVQIQSTGVLYFNNSDNTNQYYWQNIGATGANNATLILSRTNAGETLRVDSSGNLLVGGTSALVSSSGRGNITVNGSTDSILAFGSAGTNTGYLYATTSGMELASIGSTFVRFSTNGSERARIDSSGNLLVGTTTFANTNTNSAILQASGGTCAFIIQHDSTNGSGNAYHAFNYNGTGIGSITQSGTTAVLYNTTSDQRLKENITDADSASTLIDALQVRKFDWKAGGSHQRYGFVAQELVTVAPEAVHQPEDIEQMMAVDYSKLVPMLVKEIQSLRKRLADAGI